MHVMCRMSVLYRLYFSEGGGARTGAGQSQSFLWKRQEREIVNRASRKMSWNSQHNAHSQTMQTRSTSVCCSFFFIIWKETELKSLFSARSFAAKLPSPCSRGIRRKPFLANPKFTIVATFQCSRCSTKTKKIRQANVIKTRNTIIYIVLYSFYLLLIRKFKW